MKNITGMEENIAVKEIVDYKKYSRVKISFMKSFDP